nr:uncharacterized protein LOC123758816 [Procambarus clarkii]
MKSLVLMVAVVMGAVAAADRRERSASPGDDGWVLHAAVPYVQARPAVVQYSQTPYVVQHQPLVHYKFDDDDIFDRKKRSAPEASLDASRQKRAASPDDDNLKWYRPGTSVVYSRPVEHAVVQPVVHSVVQPVVHRVVQPVVHRVVQSVVQPVVHRVVQPVLHQVVPQGYAQPGHVVLHRGYDDDK